MSAKILFKFIEKGINLSPDAYNKILSLEDPLNFSLSLIVKLKSQKYSKNDLISLDESIVDEFIKTLEVESFQANGEDNSSSLNSDFNRKSNKNSSTTLNPNISDKSEKIIENGINTNDEKKYKNGNQSSSDAEFKIKDKIEANSDLGKIEKIDNSISDEIKRNLLEPNTQFDFKIIQDTSKKSYTSGEISNLISYFKNRYEKLSNILSKRPELKVHQKISDITNDTKDINIIGIIKEIRSTKNNHKMIEIEDDTGEISVLVHKDNHDLFNTSEKLVKDEIIGLLAENKGNLIIASRIIHPGVQRVPEKKMDFATVFTSDIHIGSLTFLEDAFVKFTKWLNGNFGNDNQREIANDVKYLLIAGDIVDGIGVYPNQEKELAIKDITTQYDEAARLLGEIRSDIKIIIGPGNHDASRVAEPQPAIPEKYAKSLYELNNIEFISNPGIVSLDGIITLMYHGRGFDDIAMTVKGMSHEKNELIMEELLNKRHLAPIYGERTPLASELEDYLVVDNVPDIFHTGHVHINRYKNYNGVHMINSGTFQTQTEFQKIYNIVPTCGEVPVLHKGNYKQLKFI
ncbi:MAG: DNA-directed DNA polymerase II small subunit [Methanobacteriaceae archaeon]|jgi:DNA polymerase II small subunit|nr:DNA-directed DNA polymerase II small subunit [Candidatus Methanorudis spinitermitis]